jgi:hypothetical protein
MHANPLRGAKLRLVDGRAARHVVGPIDDQISKAYWAGGVDGGRLARATGRREPDLAALVFTSLTAEHRQGSGSSAFVGEMPADKKVSRSSRRYFLDRSR